MKERILKKFDKSTYIEPAEIDEYIVDIMKEINSYPNIMTEMSCEGHWIEDGGYSVPYFTFLVDRKGWDIFWLECAPKLTTGIELDDTHSKLKRAFYATIKLNDYIEGVIDYCCIGVYGPEEEDLKEIFWNLIKNSFRCFEDNRKYCFCGKESCYEEPGFDLCDEHIMDV